MTLAPEAEVKIRNEIAEAERRLGLFSGGLSRMARFAEVVDGRVYVDYGNGKVSLNDAAEPFARMAHPERFADNPDEKGGTGGDGPTKEDMAKLSPQEKIKLAYDQNETRRREQGRR